jgi:uncharacterized protein
MLKTFQPPKWLKNSHLQTCLPTIISKLVPQLPFLRELITLPDGDQIEIATLGNTSHPCILLMHGLEGGVYSPYIQSTTRALLKNNFQVLVMQYRGCNGKINLKAKSYNGYDDTDLVYLLQYLVSTNKKSPIYAAGFSMGGNILLHHVYNHPDTVLKGIITVSTPFDMQNAVDIMPALYHKNFANSIKKKLFKKLDANIHLPVTYEDVKAMQSLFDIDNAITAPLSGHNDARAYYKYASCNTILEHIRTPALMIHALDDPFINQSTIPPLSAFSPNVTLQQYTHGGHVGFIAKKAPDATRFWIADEVTYQIARHNQAGEWIHHLD